MITLFKAIQAEGLKVRSNLMFIMLALMPIIVTLIVTIYFLFSGNETKANTWILYIQDTSIFYMTLYPALIALIGFVYVDLEVKNNCNKQMFYLPIKLHEFYFAKCMILLIYYTISSLVAYSSLVLGINILDVVFPAISESAAQYHSITLINSLFIKIYIIFLPLIFLQYSVSLFVPKVWLPCSLGFFLYIGGFLSASNDYFYLLPNASFTRLTMIELISGNIVFFDKVFAVSILYTILFFSIGYFAFKKSKYKIDS